ncbi:ankyrin [Xylariaceae sp. FL1651]|nr:ankyrin [Xylariaceae sp. FL1651]
MPITVSDDDRAKLFEAARHANIIRLDSCLVEIAQRENATKEDILAQTKDRDGMTIMHIAAQSGQINVLEYYLTVFAHQASLCRSLLTAVTITNDMPMHMAARTGQSSFIHALCQQNININTPGAFGFTVLHYAAHKKNTALVKDLIKMNADLNALSVSGETAMHVAAHKEDLETTKALLKGGALVDIRNASDLTPGVISRNTRNTRIHEYFRAHNLPC